MSVIVIAAPPTPNGDLHLGHLSGPYTGADIFTRACRLAGRDTELLIGSDIHQSYMTAKARELGSDVYEVADRFDAEIERLFARVGISNRQYVKPEESGLHAIFVQDFFRRLYVTGKIRSQPFPSMYCAACDVHLVEAYLTGTCARCGNDDCDGGLCEKCAWPNSCVDLIRPRCNFCGGCPQRTTLERLVFPLGEYADVLRQFCRTAVLSPQLEILCEQFLEQGLPDIAVTQPMPWGVPVTVPGFRHQRYLVWAEMLPGYFACLAESLLVRGREAGEWRQEWDSCEIAQFFGWDNGYFHALLFPALMAAYDVTLRLPSALLTNEFYQLDDLKFSTSRQHAIWGNDFLRVIPPDVCRFVLALDRPEFRETSFSVERFHAIVNDELAGRWQPWLAGVLERAAGITVAAPVLEPAHRCFVRSLDTLAADCMQCYTPESYSAGRAARALIELVARASDFSATQSRNLPADRGAGARHRASAAAAEASAARLLAQLAAPIMPAFSQALWAALGEAGAPAWDGTKAPRLGTAAMPSQPFFSPIHLDPGEIRPNASEVSARSMSS
jgi:methionyl-tRNA synthetase